MSRFSKMKKTLTGVVSAAVLTSSVTAASAVTSVSAASDPNYMEALALSLYFFDSNACGSGVTDGPLTWRGDCHTYDANASVGSLSSSLKSIVDPDGDGKIDVSGGFHDAGDHIKFNLTIGFGASSLALSEYLNPGIYEEAGCKDHLIYELRWASDYLMKTTFLDDSGEVAAIAHVVADGNVDHSFWTSPEVQTYDRPVYWLTSASNNSAVCGEMASALAGTAYVLQDTDPEYAYKCIDYANALVRFGTKYVGNETGGLGGFYGTDSQYQDEMALAQAWLWVLGEGSKPTYTPSGGDYGGGLYDGYVYCWDKVWQGYSALMYKASGDSVFRKELEYEYPNEGGISETSYNASGWGASRYNCAKQMRALVLADGDPNSSYAKAAKFQMDHILGNNSYGYSFLIGYGDKWPTHIHHRAANPGSGNETSAANPSAKYTNYGMLVGGDDNSGYEDHADRYQYTEGALDYNGCFALACAGLANLYGGDTSAVKDITSSADEINDSFVFVESSNTGTGTQTTASTTKRTTTTTTTVATVKRTEPVSIPSGQTEIQVKLNGADAIEVVVSASSGGTGNGAIDCTNTSGQYQQFGAYNYTMSSGGTYETTASLSGVSAQNDTVTVHLWWSDNSSVISAINLVYYDVVSNTTTESTTTTTTTTTVQPTGLKAVYGDANEDGEINIADAVLILQSISNPDKYTLTAQGKLNADCVDGDGVTSKDALAIQMVEGKSIQLSDLPIASSALQ